MHGLGLTTLLKSDSRAFSAGFSKKKNIETLTEGPRKYWNKIESLTVLDRMASGFFVKFFSLEANNDRDKWFDEKMKSHLINGNLQTPLSSARVETHQEVLNLTEIEHSLESPQKSQRPLDQD